MSREIVRRVAGVSSLMVMTSGVGVGIARLVTWNGDKTVEMVARDPIILYCTAAFLGAMVMGAIVIDMGHVERPTHVSDYTTMESIRSLASNPVSVAEDPEETEDRLAYARNLSRNITMYGVPFVIVDFEQRNKKKK